MRRERGRPRFVAFRKTIYGAVCVGICLCLTALESSPSGLPSASLTVIASHFRSIGEFDPGTVHLYVANPGREPVRISSAELNGVPITENGGELAAWWYVAPNPVPPGGIARVDVKLRFPTRKIIGVSLRAEASYEVFHSLRPTSPEFYVSFVGFSEGFDRAHVYVRNASANSVTPTELSLRGESAGDCLGLGLAMEPGELRCLMAEVVPAAVPGEPIPVVVSTDRGLRAAAVVPAFASFPVWFDDEIAEGESYFLENAPSVATLARCPSHFPSEDIRHNAQLVLRAYEDRLAHAPRAMQLLRVCRYRREIGLAFSGGLGDAVLLNPAVLLPPSLSSPYCPQTPPVLEATEFMTRLAVEAWWPKRVFVTIPVSPRQALPADPYAPGRPATPQEVRLMVYGTLAHGARGIMYRVRAEDLQSGGALAREIRKLNAEVEALSPLISVGELADIASCADESVEARAILSGRSEIVLLLINHAVVRGALAEVPTRASPIRGARVKTSVEVTVRVPPGMQIQDVFDVGEAWERLAYEARGADVVVRVPHLGLTRQVVLSADANAFVRDADNDGLPDIKELANSVAAAPVP